MDSRGAMAITGRSYIGNICTTTALALGGPGGAQSSY